MGRKLLLLGTKLTDLAAPKLAVIDPIESAGSIFLMEPARTFAAGIPANGAVVPNLFATQAASIMGNGALATDANGMFYRTGLAGGTDGLTERSTKGGIHTIFSQTVNDASNSHSRIEFSTKLREYLVSKYTDSLYISLWARSTRKSRNGSQTTDYAGIGNGISTTGSYKLRFENTRVAQGGDAGVLGYKVLGSTFANDPVGPTFYNGARSTFTGTAPPNAGGLYAYAMLQGNAGTVNTYSTARGATASHVFYRFYLENLTLSGRTYAQVDAIDTAEYTRHVLTPGGRYYGDTFTDPATIA